MSTDSIGRALDHHASTGVVHFWTYVEVVRRPRWVITFRGGATTAVGAEGAGAICVALAAAELAHRTLV